MTDASELKIPLPLLVPDTWPEAYREGLIAHELRVPHCVTSDTWFFPPAVICPACGSSEPEPTPVSGRGHVYSYSVLRHTIVTQRDYLPYVIAVIALDDTEGVRVVGNIVPSVERPLEIGAAVEASWEGLEIDPFMPRWRLL
jgi:hypothetical protein